MNILTIRGGTGMEALAAFLPDVNGDIVGAAEMALAPAGFPAGLNSGVFIGFHGSFTLAGVGNVGDPVLYYGFDTASASPHERFRPR